MPGEEHVRLDFSDTRAFGPAETRFSLTNLHEDEIRDLASGCTPAVVRAMAMACLSWQDEDARKAARPEPRKRRKSA